MMNTDNQQATLTEAHIAWLAGIIDGEGTLALGAYARDEKGAITSLKVSANVVIYNTDAGIIKQVLSIFDALGTSYYVKEREQKPMSKEGGGYYAPNGPMLVVLVKGMEHAYNLLVRLHPWLFGEKKARAEIMMRYLKRRIDKIADNGGNHRNVKLDITDLHCVQDFYKLTKAKSSPAVKRVLNELERCTER